MNLTRRSMLALMGSAAGLAACARAQEEVEPEVPAEEEAPVPQEVDWEPTINLDEFEDLAINMDAWQYDEANDCYYQLALPYCISPGSEQYESLSIFVPGAYLTGTRRGNGYSCTVAEDAQVGQFTPKTAPIAMPINSVSCEACACPTSYSYEGLGRYLKHGIVYVYAGFRGRSGGYESTTQEYFSGGVPWPVTDLKAAVRFLRYNAGSLPCNTSRIFAFGLGAGGGIGSILGVSGNAPSFDPYLQALGAATHDAEGASLTDDVYGLATWCTMGSFESADAAYEWMMGQYSSEGTRADGTWTKLLSDDLADAYGPYVNALGLKDAEGSALQLDRIDDGSYTGGTYYAHLVDVIAEAAADFLGQTEFPYAAVPLDAGTRLFPGDPSLRTTTPAGSETASGDGTSSATGVRQIEATVYDTIESYIATLNGGNRWLTYNASTGAVDVTGLWGFVQSCRAPEKYVCAYDRIDRSGLANQLFGTDEQPSLHFDAMVSKLVESGRARYAEAKGWDDTLVSEWRGDLVEPDALEKTVTERVEMSDPLALLASSDEEGAGFAIAPHWRINTGLFQSQTTLVGETNLACALAADERVADVSFETVWGAGFELAERSGDPENNLVAWIEACCPQDEEAPSEQVIEEDQVSAEEENS